LEKETGSNKSMKASSNTKKKERWKKCFSGGGSSLSNYGPPIEARGKPMEGGGRQRQGFVARRKVLVKSSHIPFN